MKETRNNCFVSMKRNRDLHQAKIDKHERATKQQQRNKTFRQAVASI